MRISDWSSDVCSSDLAGASSSISPQGHPHPAFHLSRYSKAQKRRVRLFGKPAIRSARQAGLRDEIKGEAFAVRRMPEDIRPEGLPAAPDPSDCGAECDRKDQCATRQTKKEGTVSGTLFDNWRSGRYSKPRPQE